MNSPLLFQEFEDPLISMQKLKWGKIENFIAQEGIYFFGGKKNFGDLNGDLWCLKIKNKARVEAAKHRKEHNNNKNIKYTATAKDLLTH